MWHCIPQTGGKLTMGAAAWGLGGNQSAGGGQLCFTSFSHPLPFIYFFKVSLKKILNSLSQSMSFLASGLLILLLHPTREQAGESKMLYSAQVPTGIEPQHTVTTTKYCHTQTHPNKDFFSTDLLTWSLQNGSEVPTKPVDRERYLANGSHHLTVMQSEPIGTTQ